MGAEFKRKQAAAFKKRLDKSLLALGTPTLFTQTPTRAPRVIAADWIGNPHLKSGDGLLIQKKGSALVAMQGLTEVGIQPNPPAELIKLIDDSFGCAKGLIEARGLDWHEPVHILEEE